jgi:hypothetical protein
MCVDCALASPRIAQVYPGDEPLPEVVLSHVVMPANDPKDLFMKRVTKFGFDILDLGDGVGLSPSLVTRGGLYRMQLLQR